jgi:hypothetical protein
MEIYKSPAWSCSKVKGIVPEIEGEEKCGTSNPFSISRKKEANGLFEFMTEQAIINRLPR